MSNSGNVGGGGLIFFLVIAALGYFVYGGIGGAIAMFILTFVYGLVSLLSLIPFVGVFVQGLAMFYLVNPWIFGFTGITSTWLTGLVFWINIIVGIFATIVTSLLLMRK